MPHLFPQVPVAPATTNGTTATTTPVVNLPSGIQQNDLLIVLIRVAVAGAIGWPDAEWVEMFDASSDGADDQMALAWRRATGSEGTTITLSSGNGKFAALAYRISGAADPYVWPPELSTVATGASTTPDPTTCTPTAGNQKYLWLWLGGWEGEQTSPPAGTPTNYTNAVGANSGTAGAITTNCRVASARRELEAASEDPPSWTISVSDDWTAYTLAVYPTPDPTDLTWAQRIDPARVVRALTAVPFIVVPFLASAAIPEEPRAAAWATHAPQPVRRIPPAQEAPPPPPWLELHGPTGEQAPQNVGGTLFGAQAIHYLPGAGPVSRGEGLPWVQAPPQPAWQRIRAGGVPVWIPFVEEETPYAWRTHPPDPIRPRGSRPPHGYAQPSTETAGFNQELAWAARGGDPPPPSRGVASGPFGVFPVQLEQVTELGWRTIPPQPVRRAVPMPKGRFVLPLVDTSGYNQLLSWAAFAPQPTRVRSRPWLAPATAATADDLSQYAWGRFPVQPVPRTPPVQPYASATPFPSTEGFNQPLAWVGGKPDVFRRVPTVAPGPFFGDPQFVATLPVAAIDGVTDGADTGTLWPRQVVHYQAVAGPVVVINLNVPELSWTPRFPEVIRRAPAPQIGGVFPLRPPGAALIDLRFAPSDDGVIRGIEVFGYQAWAGPLVTNEPDFRSDLPWVHPLQPVRRRTGLPPIMAAQPPAPPAAVVHPVWQSQAATQRPQGRPVFAPIRYWPPIPVPEAVFEVSWLPRVLDPIRRLPDPGGFKAESPFPQAGTTAPDLPWLPPPLTFRAPLAPWTPTPIQPWEPPVTVPELAWSPPYHPIIYRRPGPLWGYALPPFPQDATSGSDLPWIQLPDPVRRTRWTPPDPWGFVVRPPDHPTPQPNPPHALGLPVRRPVPIPVGPFTAIPPRATTDLVWWPSAPALWRPWNAGVTQVFVPGWDLVVIGDQWCIQVTSEIGIQAALHEEIGIQAALTNEIGLTAQLAAEENC